MPCLIRGMTTFRHSAWYFVFLFFLVFAFHSDAADSSSFIKIKNAEPSLREIMNVHLQREHLSDDEFQGWQKRIRTAPYLPQLYLGYDQQLKKSDSLSINDNISVSDGIVTEAPEDNNYDIDNDVGQVFRVRAVWELDEIIFHRHQFPLANVRRQYAVERSRVSDALYKIYEARYLCLAQYFATKATAPQKADQFYTKYLLLTDRLDELTAGKFTDRFWRKP